ncbi:MAG: hypothetical protein LBM08_09265 [Dysgonamonadaceae bacterium]|jgi:hypothetical protein|nr:hypothetical protein [Dysgonamonadaceae bacterium]
MKTIYSFLAVFVLSWCSWVGVHAQIITLKLPASGDSEYISGDAMVMFDTPLEFTEAWKIEATTLYKGEASNGWGSRLFQALVERSPLRTSGQMKSESSFCFYQRPPVGAVGTNDPSGKLLLANAAFTEALDVDKENGTLYEFVIESDGMGNVVATATVNGSPYTKAYNTADKTTTATQDDNGGALTVPWTAIYGICAGSNYDVEVTITGGSFEPSLQKLSPVLFGDIMQDAFSEKTVSVRGINLSSDIVATVIGDDRDAFSVAPATLPSTGGSFVIRFSPTEKKAYDAQLVISSEGAKPDTTTLSGTADFELPVTISTEDDEHWYFIQFARNAPQNIVVKYNGLEEYITQADLDTENDSLKWKIVGNWDEYLIVNKVDGSAFAYHYYNPRYNESSEDPAEKDSISDKYIATEIGNAEGHGFVRYKETDTWQLYNFVNLDKKANEGYVNDKAAKNVCLYSLNDGGNQLLFLSAEKPAIITAPSLAFSDIPKSASETLSIVVTGSKLTDNITATLSGTGAEDFKLSSNILPATGDSLHITYAPLANRKDSVILTLTSPNADAVEVLLTGNSDLDLPLFSEEGGDEYWYFIQFVRSAEKGDNNAGKVLSSGGYENAVTQENWNREDMNQWWKVVGSWNSYKIVDNDNNEFVFDLTDKRMKLASLGEGNSFKFVRNTTAGKWQLYNLTTDDGEETPHYYVNDFGGNGEEVGMWSANDGGNSLNFIPVSASNSIDEITANDTLVAKRYYTLLGVEVTAPFTTGIYIVKEIYDTKKTKVYKVLIAAN